MFYVYILKSQSDQNLYIGFTQNLRKRLRRHANGEVYSTSWRRPLQLIYYEAYLSREDAWKRERFFKTGWGRNYIQRNLAGSLDT